MRRHLIEPDDLLRLVTFNVWVGQHPKRLRRNLRRLVRQLNHPHVIALQEAKRFRGTIPGYQRLACTEPQHEDDLDCVLLVRNDVAVIHPRIVRVDGPMWRGPKHGLAHAPKVFVGATLEHLGRRWDVLNVHRTWTGRGRHNMASWNAEDTKLHSWLTHRAQRANATRPVIALGDWNGGLADRRYDATVARLAHDVDAQYAFSGIDGALAINVSDVSRRELDDLYGSDGHHPVSIRAWA